MIRNASELEEAILGGQEVTLAESVGKYLAFWLPGPIAMILGGIALIFLKGPVWGILAAVGALALVGIFASIPFRTAPVLQISKEGITWKETVYPWTEIDAFGVEKIQYCPDAVTVKQEGEENLSLESAFGWKCEKLRDALNQILVKLNPESSRASFERGRKQ